jgi:hypothetical protein
MSDTSETETESNFEIRKEWVRPELKELGIEQITTSHHNGTYADGSTSKYSG